MYKHDSLDKLLEIQCFRDCPVGDGVNLGDLVDLPDTKLPAAETTVFLDHT